MFKFETLDIWKKSMEFGRVIYRLSKKIPKSEQFGLTSQLIRAGMSISLNIAEGSSRKSKIDFNRFIQMALGSLNEVVTCLYFAKSENYFTDNDFNNAYTQSEEISKMLYGFQKYLER
ncbi:MAG: four helix bundle protein [Candidatus Omnitrophota bacterium]